MSAELEDIHEECGIFGVWGHPDASRLTYFGLHALQHRGQEGAGIVSNDNGHLIGHRGLGLLTQVFGDEREIDTTCQSIDVATGPDFSVPVADFGSFSQTRTAPGESFSHRPSCISAILDGETPNPSNIGIFEIPFHTKPHYSAIFVIRGRYFRRQFCPGKQK